MNHQEVISIKNLKASLYLGVPEEERTQLQVVLLTFEILPQTSFWGTGDRIEKTINYYEVTQTAMGVASQRPRKLVETLIEDLFAALMNTYPVAQLRVEVRKFIIPQAEYISLEASLTREEWGRLSSQRTGI